MSGNQALIQKATENLAALAPGGKLIAEQAQDFFRVSTKASKFLSYATVNTTENPQHEQPKIGFQGTVLRAGNESVPLPENDRAAPVHDKVTLTPQLFKGEVVTTYEALEDAVNRNRFADLLQSLAAEQVAADIEMACIQGDTASTTSLLKPIDGIIKQTVTNLVAGGGVRLNSSILTKMLRAMPEEYESQESKWKFFTNKNACIDYWQTFGDRQTTGGDAARTGAPVGGQRAGAYGYHGGVEIVSIPLWPRKLTGTGGTLDHTTVMLLDPKNVCVTFRRDVQVKMGEDIRKGEVFFVFSVRFDCKILHEPAVVMANDISAAP